MVEVLAEHSGVGVDGGELGGEVAEPEGLHHLEPPDVVGLLVEGPDQPVQGEHHVAFGAVHETGQRPFAEELLERLVDPLGAALRPGRNLFRQDEVGPEVGSTEGVEHLPARLFRLVGGGDEKVGGFRPGDGPFDDGRRQLPGSGRGSREELGAQLVHGVVVVLKRQLATLVFGAKSLQVGGEVGDRTGFDVELELGVLRAEGRVHLAEELVQGNLAVGELLLELSEPGEEPGRGRHSRFGPELPRRHPVSGGVRGGRHPSRTGLQAPDHRVDGVTDNRKIAERLEHAQQSGDDGVGDEGHQSGEPVDDSVHDVEQEGCDLTDPLSDHRHTPRQGEREAGQEVDVVADPGSDSGQSGSHGREALLNGTQPPEEDPDERENCRFQLVPIDGVRHAAPIGGDQVHDLTENRPGVGKHRTQESDHLLQELEHRGECFLEGGVVDGGQEVRHGTDQSGEHPRHQFSDLRQDRSNPLQGRTDCCDHRPEVGEHQDHCTQG